MKSQLVSFFFSVRMAWLLHCWFWSRAKHHYHHHYTSEASYLPCILKLCVCPEDANWDLTSYQRKTSRSRGHEHRKCSCTWSWCQIQKRAHILRIIPQPSLVEARPSDPLHLTQWGSVEWKYTCTDEVVKHKLAVLNCGHALKEAIIILQVSSWNWDW